MPPGGNEFADNIGIAIEKLLSLSEAMLDAARAGEWPQLIEYEARRSPLLEDFFSVWNKAPDKLRDVQTIRVFIETVQGIDKKVLLLAESEKEATANSLSKLKNARHATSAYAENT